MKGVMKGVMKGERKGARVQTNAGRGRAREHRGKRKVLSRRTPNILS